MDLPTEQKTAGITMLRSLALTEALGKRIANEVRRDYRTGEMNTREGECHLTQGCQLWLQIGSEWSQMGQIWDFLMSFFSTLWLVDLKKDQDLFHLEPI